MPKAPSAVSQARQRNLSILNLNPLVVEPKIGRWLEVEPVLDLSLSIVLEMAGSGTLR